MFGFDLIGEPVRSLENTMFSGLLLFRFPLKIGKGQQTGQQIFGTFMLAVEKGGKKNGGDSRKGKRRKIGVLQIQNIFRTGGKRKTDF
jgi:hypothetical protein